MDIPFPDQQEQDVAQLKKSCLEGREVFVVNVVRCSDHAVMTSATTYDDIDRAYAGACNMMWLLCGNQDSTVIKDNAKLKALDMFMVMSLLFKGKCVGAVSRVFCN